MPTTNAFLATFLACVANTLKWGGAHTFHEAVVLCSQPSVAMGSFKEAGYAESAITASRLAGCARSLSVDPTPCSYAIGTVVRYTGEDLSPVLGSDDLIIMEASYANNVMHYAVAGVAWVPHSDLEYVAAATPESLAAVWAASN